MSGPAVPGDGLVAGVDVATSDVRVRVVDAGGATLATGRSRLPAPRRPQPGHAEQDATSWWPAARDALREATSALGADARRIVAVAVSATSGTIVAVDDAGAPLAPALMYDDRRAGAQAAIAQEADAGRWARLGVTITPAFALAKLGWLAADGGLEAAARVCHTSDVLTRALCGTWVPTDASHALKTGWDALEGEWPHAALDALEVDEGLLGGAAGTPTTPVGSVCAEAAGQTGLPADCEVRLGMTDGCAGQVACGAVRPGDAVSVLGTTLVLKAVSAELVRDPSGAVYCHRHPDGLWLPGGASSTGGEALADAPRDALAGLDAAARERGPSSVVAYPLRRSGERFPFVAPEAEGFVEGDPQDAADAHRAALEGVAFVERLAYEHLAELGAPASGTLTAAGGGSRSDVWTAIRATALGRPLVRVRDADTAMGAALLAAAGTLHPDLATAAGAMTRTDGVVEPVEAECDALDERYARFCAALDRRGWR